MRLALTVARTIADIWGVWLTVYIPYIAKQIAILAVACVASRCIFPSTKEDEDADDYPLRPKPNQAHIAFPAK